MGNLYVLDRGKKRMITKKIRVYGIVQGVGFRPTVSRHAAAAGITGSVCNKGPYVEIFAQGEEKCVKDFLERLEKQPPKRAAILKINTEDVKEEEYGKFNDFQIIESEKTKGRYSSRRILQSAKNARKKCTIRKTGVICTHLSTAPAAVPDLRSWMRFHMTGNGPA